MEWTFRVDRPGQFEVHAELAVEQAGKHTLSIKPDEDDWQPINLRRLELKRQ